MICIGGVCLTTEWWQLFMAIPLILTVFWTKIKVLMGYDVEDQEKCCSGGSCSMAKKKGVENSVVEEDAESVAGALVYSPGDAGELKESLEDMVASGYSAVLVDLFAEWCGPCKKISPRVDMLAVDENIPVLKIDVEKDYNGDDLTAAQFLPTFKLMRITEDLELEPMLMFKDVTGPNLSEVVDNIRKLQKMTADDK
eukprot:GHVH01017489.1.p1 GENE.GHVH01017489.1~~GHVH01017489.1.p1  ORF type:complete len:197 (+),score=39.38 GHVH01017489.1:86-676(+)